MKQENESGAQPTPEAVKLVEEFEQAVINYRDRAATVNYAKVQIHKNRLFAEFSRLSTQAPRPMKLERMDGENRTLTASPLDLQPQALEMFRRMGIVFDGKGGKWEATAFSLYSMMAEARWHWSSDPRVVAALDLIHDYQDDDARVKGPETTIARIREILEDGEMSGLNGEAAKEINPVSESGEDPK